MKICIKELEKATFWVVDESVLVTDLVMHLLSSTLMHSN
jgi:hypothetical protein